MALFCSIINLASVLRASPPLRRLRCWWLVVLSQALLFWPASAAVFSEARFHIVTRGQPKAQIVVVGERPEPPLVFAAAELQRYVNEMSGAELPITQRAAIATHLSTRTIVLVTRPLQQDRRPSQDPREEDHYRLNIDARKLQIEGASPRAVLYGVYDVLERLGCGWCVPGEDSVPKHDALALAPLRLDARPAF